MKKIICICMVAVMICIISGCSAEADRTAGGADGNGIAKLSFKSTASIDYLKSLDGKKVTINGYLATSSPADGSFIFLMNLPYQSCPFCIPNTSQLVNTLEVYPKTGQKFGFTTQAVSVTGVLEFSKDGLFTDAYGYEFEYRLADAEYYILSDEELSDNIKTYNIIADSGIIDDLYRMYDYVYFTCAWNEYFCNSYTDADGNYIPGYYLWPSDIEPCLQAQYSYADRDFFDGMLKKIETVCDSKTAGIMKKNIADAEQLAEDALNELSLGNYTGEYQYIEMFGTEDWIYSLNNGTKLQNRYSELYIQFCDWINSFEM